MEISRRPQAEARPGSQGTEEWIQVSRKKGGLSTIKDSNLPQHAAGSLLDSTTGEVDLLPSASVLTTNQMLTTPPLTRSGEENPLLSVVDLVAVPASVGTDSAFVKGSVAGPSSSPRAQQAPSNSKFWNLLQAPCLPLKNHLPPILQWIVPMLQLKQGNLNQYVPSPPSFGLVPWLLAQMKGSSMLRLESRQTHYAPPKLLVPLPRNRKLRGGDREILRGNLCAHIDVFWYLEHHGTSWTPKTS